MQKTSFPRKSQGLDLLGAVGRGRGRPENALEWITAPASPLMVEVELPSQMRTMARGAVDQEDRFTRRPSLEVEHGELVLRSRPSTGETGAASNGAAVSLLVKRRTATPVKPFKHSPDDPGPTDGADCVKPNGLHAGRFAAALGLEGQAFQGKPAKAGASLGASLNGEISIFRPGSNGSDRLHQRDPGCAEYQVQGATLHAPTTPGPRGVDHHLRSSSQELRSPLRTSIADTYTPLARGFTSISDTLRIEPRVCNHVLHQNPQSPDDSKKSKSASAVKVGTSHVFVRPSSATRGGRDAADQMPLHWQSSVKRSSSSDGRSSRQSRQVASGNSSAGSKLQGTTAVVQNEEGEPSPQMMSPDMLNCSSESPVSMLSPESNCEQSSPDDFSIRRLNHPRIGSASKRPMSNRTEASLSQAGLDEQDYDDIGLRSSRGRRSPEISPEIRSQDTSPLASSSGRLRTPHFTPQPPTSDKNGKNPHVRPTGVGLRLPPVASASPQLSTASVSPVSSLIPTIQIDSVPSSRDPLCFQIEGFQRVPSSREVFQNAVAKIQKKLKSSKGKSKKKSNSNAVPGEEGPFPGEDSPLGVRRGGPQIQGRQSPLSESSPLGASRPALSGKVWSPLQREERQRDKGSVALVRQTSEALPKGGNSPVPPGLRRHCSTSLPAAPTSPIFQSRFRAHAVYFDPSRPSLYVCQRDRRSDVLTKIHEVRGIYRSIMQAVNMAVDGDTIQIVSGTYEENVVIDRNVFVKAVAGEEVIVRGQNLATIHFTGMSGKIQDLTLEHDGGDPTLRGQSGVRCIEVHEGDFEMVNCTVSSKIGSGIMLLDGCYVAARKSRIIDNGRCGIIAFEESRLFCEDCLINDNGLNGMDLQTGSNATSSRSRIEKNGQTGVLVSDCDTFATLMDCNVSSNSRRGITAQHHGTFVLRNCTIMDNRDCGILVLGDVQPCCCILDKCTISSNEKVEESQSVTIHGSVPDISSCNIQGQILLLHTPIVRPSPMANARHFAGAQTIQSAWRCHFARLNIRREVQLFLKRLADEAAAAERERAKAEIARRNASSPDRGDPSPEAKASSEDRPERFEGMAELEADVLETMKRFDKLSTNMDKLFEAASKC